MVVIVGLERTIKSLAKVALVVGGIYAVIQLTPVITYYTGTKVPLVVAAAGGAGVGYAVSKATT